MASEPDYLRLQPNNIAAASDWWSEANDGARAFGGQITAHCIIAAGRAAPPNFSMHSLHLHFLRAGNCVATRYDVAPVRVGRSYAVYRVVGVETDSGKEIASAVIGFCKHEDGESLHTTAAPPLPAPSESSDASAWPQIVPADDSGRRWRVRWNQKAGDGTPLTAASAPIAHAAALGFISDYYFLWSSLYPHRHSGIELRMLASLDHAIHLHAPDLDASEEMLYEVDTPWASKGRALVRGRLWSARTGKLLASTVQEGVLRGARASKL